MATSTGYGQAAPTTILRDPPPRRALATDTFVSLRGAADRARSRSLTQLVESEIMPRLLVAVPQVAVAPASAVTADEVADFAPLALQVEADALIDRAEAMLARGVTVEALLVDLLAPAARMLGEYWESDRCDFVDVTMALWRLQEVVHEVALRGPGGRRTPAPARSALFSALPGDQHGFGALVVEEVFARAGWVTDRITDPTLSELYDRIGAGWFDVIGLTVSCDCNTGALPSIITALRSVSRNPRIVVMVGGRVFVEDPALAMQVGADGTARDAYGAVALATELVGATASEGVARG